MKFIDFLMLLLVVSYWFEISFSYVNELVVPSFPFFSFLFLIKTLLFELELSLVSSAFICLVLNFKTCIYCSATWKGPF